MLSMGTLPKTTAQWVLPTQDGFQALTLRDAVPLQELGAEDVLVKLQAASINYRDLVIAKVHHRPSKDELARRTD
jgi:NADPH:quinone reductase-like Zn-dependent oxidoreductase